MVYILTSNGNILKVEVRPQEARENDSAVSVNLSLLLKKQLSDEVFSEQKKYLESASKAAHTSLNFQDQSTRFKASVTLKSQTDESLNFIKGSSSSGLGFTLGLFNSFFADVLQKNKGFNQPVFATGEVHNNCEIKPIGHLDTKINGMIKFCKEQGISSFYLCIPKENKEDLSPKTFDLVSQNGGEIIAKNTVQESLLALLGDQYDGDPLGRWEPFKGLKSFDYQDASRFKGRDEDVKRLFSDVKSNNGFLIVTGPTGSGKSSLIKAGLIPYLHRKNLCDGWVSCTPSDLEKESLIQKVTHILVNDKKLNLLEVRALELVIREQQTSAITKAFSELSIFSKSYFIHIDQFEDVFTNAGFNIVLNELKILKNVLNLSNDIKIVISLRNEYLPDLLECGLIQSPVISNVSNVLTPESWSEIIIKQAKESGVEFENNGHESLQQLLIDQAIKTPNALAMVQYVLKQLYELAQQELDNKNTLRLEHFHEMGGIAGAIATRAEHAIRETRNSDEVVNQLFSLFVNVNSDGLPFARAIEWVDEEHQPSEMERLLSSLYETNIVLKEKSVQGNKTYKFAHESLFKSWPRLENWVADQKEFLIWKSSIDRRFQEWKLNSVVCPFKGLISDSKSITKGIQFQKKGLINDSKLSTFLDLSNNRMRLRLAFNVAALSYVVIFLVVVIPGFSYDTPKFEVNTKTCDTGSSIKNVLEVSLANEWQADDLEQQFCNGGNKDIASEYGKVKFSWASLEDSYELEKLFNGKIAVVQGSESSLVASNIISNPKLYTPIAKYPDYYACLYASKGTDKPKLTNEYFEGKTLGLNNRVYSTSGYQVPYLSIIEEGIKPSITQYPSHRDLQNALANGQVDLIGTYCEYKRESKYPFIKFDRKKLTGTTWYVSNNIGLESFKSTMQQHLCRWAQSEDAPLYFRDIEILNGEKCE
jgi:energy-coupling factor transporter ATP-binding protein EcfA2